MKRILAIGIILMFIGMSISSSTGFNVREQSNTITSNGKTLYVGGSGAGNYTKIQDAIDDASDGDTVFVYNGSYRENVVVNKTINLVGEEKENTIIYNNESSVNIFIINDGVSVTGFSLHDDSNTSLYNMGIAIMANFTIIKNNLILSKRHFGIIINDWYGYSSYHNNTIIENKLLDGVYNGIYLRRSYDNIISENSILHYDDGIQLEQSDSNIISNNNFTSNLCAMYLDDCYYNTISNNTFNENIKSIHLNHYCSSNLIISNNIKGTNKEQIGYCRVGIGIYIVDSSRTEIRRNKIYHYTFGLFLESSSINYIEKNTFVKNIINARFINFGYSSNKWSENYWNRPRILPKPIFGIDRIYHILPRFLEFDWHPALKSYDIEV